jgi:hypothetical protein
VPEHEGDRRAKRGDLREREIDEHDVTGEHLDAEIGVDADEAERHQERRPQELERCHHCLGMDPLGTAAMSAAMFSSNSER